MKTTVTIIVRSEYTGTIGETVKNEDETFLGHGDSLKQATDEALLRVSWWLNAGKKART